MVGSEVRFIDFYENSGEEMSHYIGVVKKWSEDNQCIVSLVILPHDAKHRNMTSSLTRDDEWKRAGYKTKVLEVAPIEDGINLTRKVLSTAHIDGARCDRGISGLMQYKKEWDSKGQTFRNHPCHDWSSNIADSMRYACTYISEITHIEAKRSKIEYVPIAYFNQLT